MKTRVMMCATALVAATAHGGVELTFLEKGAGSNVSVTFFGETRDVFAGQLIHQVAGLEGGLSSFNGRQVTFCPDFPEPVATGPTMFKLVDLADVPVTLDQHSQRVDAAQADAIRRLFSNGGSALVDGSGDNDRATAFQLVLWEIIYDFDGSQASIDVDAGNISVIEFGGAALSAGIMADIADLSDFALNGDVTTGVLALAEEGVQDQIFIPTPAPLALGAAFGLVAARRRRG